MKITVLGCGAFGIGIAKMLSKNANNNIVIWTSNKKTYDYFVKYKKFEIFNDFEIPNNISVTYDLCGAINKTELIFLASSSKYIEDLCNSISKFYKKTPICIATKGIDDKSLTPLSLVVKNILKTNNIAVISGPTFAIDLMNNNPCALAIAALNNSTYEIVKNNLQNDTLKLRRSTDIVGVQLCGCIKNIIAIASGILKGLGYTESTEAFLINESLHDIKKIIKSLGGKKKTILSFAGVGDIFLTCSSEKSRNFSFGYVIGSTNNKDKIKEYLNNNTVEGYIALKSIYTLLEKKGIDIPLINQIYNIVYNNENPHNLATFLINKD